MNDIRRIRRRGCDETIVPIGHSRTFSDFLENQRQIAPPRASDDQPAYSSFDCKRAACARRRRNRFGVGLPARHVDPHRLGHQLGDVADLLRLPAAVEHAADVHRAAGVVADHRLRAGRGDAVRFVFYDRAADCGILDGEGPAEAAALVGLLQRRELDALDLPEQFEALILHADAAEVAGVVVRAALDGRQFELREVDLEHLVEKLDELVSARGDLVQPVLVGVVALE